MRSSRSSYPLTNNPLGWARLAFIRPAAELRAINFRSSGDRLAATRRARNPSVQGPARGLVRIAVKAAAVNFFDLLQLAGT
jgi:hypothetical protein